MGRKMLFLLFCMPWLVHAQAEIDLADFTLQDLADINITLVSKKQEKAVASAAAVTVLTHEDIQRSGATSIPEVLRLVPGFQVARIDANKWAVSTRGFIGRFSNKLLVLIDGRSVYSPLFSGVFWSMQDVMMEDIDRIEIVRGPGATLWGANAVNGIINIVTKPAKTTQGLLVAGIAGTEEKASAGVRYGCKQGEQLFIRGFSKIVKRDPGVHEDGSRAADGWDIFHNGFRVDWEKSPSLPVMFQADMYFGTLGHTLNLVELHPPRMLLKDYRGDIRGWHMQCQAQSIFENASVLNVRSYVDYAYREEGITTGRLTTFDADVDYLFDLGRRHQVIAGAGSRFVKHDYDSTFIMSICPSKRLQSLYSAFIQDEIRIHSLLRLTVGSKFEHHFYTGFEIQPNIRLLYTPSGKHTIWAAVSRAVRTPSLAETEGVHVAYIDSIPSLLELPILFGFQGNPDFDSEILTAYEMGYRWLPAEDMLVDVAAFYNRYNNITSANVGSIDTDPSPVPEYILFLATDENKIAGSILGIETLVDWNITDDWRMQLSYTYTDVSMHTFGGGISTVVDHVANLEGQCPHHQGFVRTFIDLTDRLTLDADLRYMDPLPELEIRRYTNMDCRLGFKMKRQMEVYLVGQNLLKKSQLEFIPELNYTLQTMNQRGFYIGLRCAF